MKLLRLTPSLTSLLLLLAGLQAGERALVDTTRSPQAVLYMPDLADVRWTGGLLGERFETCRRTMVPHLWDIFRDPQASHAWDNFLMAAGLGEGRGDGKPHGPPFNDGDFLKWLEALAQVYAITREPGLDAQMDRIIAVVARAQREDGYLHTTKIIPQRRGQSGTVAREFEDREHFETYNMGHLMTTACVHYRVTGKTTLLEPARRAADYIERLCARAPEDLARNAICPSHYMGVVELYRVTRESRYLALAQKLIEIRSLVPKSVGSDHNQDRVPFRQMTKAVGHAVRANYLYAGVADVYAENGDTSLLSTLQALADDVAGRKLYITGMTGAIYDGASPDGVDHRRHAEIKTVHQAYGRDYQLPNLTAYNETCATIGYALWCWRMLAVSGDGRYADLIEQTLYNGILPGISLEGRHYFYVNALRTADDFDWPLRWSRTRTPNIQASFCCPPNVVRTIAEMHNYVYALSRDALWVNLYASSTLDSGWIEGGRVRLRQVTDYPWSGDVGVEFESVPEKEFALRLRVPGWLRPGAWSASVNGEPVRTEARPGAYQQIVRRWRAGDRVTIRMELKPALWEANPLIEETLNQVAVRVGPLVYCLESPDLPPGMRLAEIQVPLAQVSNLALRAGSIAGVDVRTVELPVLAHGPRPWNRQELYREVQTSPARPVTVRAIPYYAWGNRGPGEMSVWLRASP